MLGSTWNLLLMYHETSMPVFLPKKHFTYHNQAWANLSPSNYYFFMMQKNLMDREWFNYDTLLRHDCLRTCLHHDMNHEWWLDLYISSAYAKKRSRGFHIAWLKLPFCFKKICMETTTTQNLIKLQSQLKTDIKSDGGHASATKKVVDLFKCCHWRQSTVRRLCSKTLR